MRVLILSNLFPPGFIGGYELGAFDIARGLTAGGHKVAVVTSDYMLDDRGELTAFEVRRVLEWTTVGRIRTPAAQVRDRDLAGGFVHSRNLRLIASEILRFRPDRVLCFNLAGLGPVGILRWLVALGYCPVVFLMDNIFEAFGKDAAGRARFEQLFGRTEPGAEMHFVFISRGLSAEVQASLGTTVPRRSFVPGWFDAAVLARPPGDAPDGEDGDIRRFVFASRVAPHKGIYLVLDAVAALVARGQTGFVVDVFGAGEVTELLVRIAARGLDRYVRYLGCPTKTELAARFADYDALLFPTWQREPFGFVAAEAAAAGCLPVMTAGIGAAEWFLSDVDSLKIGPDADSLAGAMHKLIVMPAPERRRMRAGARTTALRFFGFDDALRTVEDILVAAKPAAGGPAVAEARRMDSAMSILGDLLRHEHHG